MKALRLASAAVAVGALLGAGSAAKADEIARNLGGVGSTTFAVEPAVVNKTLKLDADDKFEVEQVWRRYGGYGYGGYRGYGYGGYGGYRGYGYGYGGYRGYGYGGYYGGYGYGGYGGYRGYGYGGYGGYRGYGYGGYGGYNNYYRPYYYGGYGYRYRWINDSAPSSTVTLSLPYVGVTVGKPNCIVPPPGVDYRQAPTLPAPNVVPPATGGYDYDGGPSSPVPMPNGTPTVPVPPAAEESNPDQNVTVTALYRVSAPAPKKKLTTVGYSAYGEKK